MNEKVLIIVTVGVGSLILILYMYRKQRQTSLAANSTGSGSPPRRDMPAWWELKNTNKNSYLDAVKNTMMDASKLTGKGPADVIVQDSSNNVITQDDLSNYATSYDPITDQGVTSIIDPSYSYDISADLNDPRNNDQIPDNIQYNLFANPDENNYEVITSKQLYDKSEYPSVVDDQFQMKDVTYYLDDTNSTTYAIPRDSINNSENIDPSLTDGVIYFPDNTDVNNENLFSLIRDSINDRVNNSSSTFLDNSIMDDAVFTIS